jgi:alginate O-acetyltransferase complex protein AlgJ
MPAPISSSSSNPAVSLHTKLAALVFIGVMLAGGWQLWQAMQIISLPAIPHNWNDFRTGSSTSTLEKQFDSHLPARDTLIATANALRYRLTFGANEQVRLGRDGWLFLTEELRFQPNASANMAARIALLQGASQMLARDGVTLVVALVPDKARVLSGYLAAGRLPDDSQHRYPDALRALRQRGVMTVDLLQPLAASPIPAYHRTDTHWNQHGAQLAAQAIADAIRALHLGLDPTSFATTSSGAASERVGDLLRLMGLEHAPNALRPPPDQEALALTRQTSAEPDVGLLGDSSVPVVLTGTSYSLRGNFHGYLQQALRAKVLNSAHDGAGFLQATTAYLKDDAYRSAKPKVLIWEVPERFLGMKLEGEAGWLRQMHAANGTNHAILFPAR